MPNLPDDQEHNRMNDTFQWICAACWHIIWGTNPPLTARCGMRRMRHDPSVHFCHCDCENQPWRWYHE